MADRTGAHATVDARPVVVRRRAAPPAAEGTRPARVLLLHGMASGGAVWDAVCARLPDAQVWVADLPWRGEGVPGWAYRPDTRAWVARALAGTGGADVVVAHSFAATLLLDLLTARDGQAGRYGVRGLVLVAPFYRPRPEDFAWDAMAGLAAGFLAVMEDGIRVSAADRGRADPRRADLHRPMALRLCAAVGPYGWHRVHDLYLRTPFMAVDRVRVPTLVVYGAGDRVTAPAEGEALAGALPAGRLCRIPGSGHHPMVERPDAFVALLRDLLAEVDRTDAPAPSTLERAR
jgi:pimeloyl-ACP methyl ester carboxylesterase